MQLIFVLAIVSDLFRSSSSWSSSPWLPSSCPMREGSPQGEPQKKKRRAQKLCFPAFNTLRAGPPTRLSIPRLRLHTSSSTSYLGPPLLIYISLGVLSLDPGGHGAAVLPCVVLFFLCSLFPPTFGSLNMSGCTSSSWQTLASFRSAFSHTP